MKKFVRVLAVLLMAALLMTACGKTADTETEAPKETVQSIQEEVVATEAAAEDVEVTEEDFLVDVIDDATCELSGCTSNTTGVIRVPEVIGGRTVVGIGDSAFFECEAKEIILPDTVTYLGEYAFNVCSNLETVDLGSGLKSAGFMAFNVCPKLKSVTFPEGMESIGMGVFMSCDVLEEVYIPASVTEFDERIASTKFCPNMVIVTPAGSAAEAQAELDGIPVKNP